MKEKQWNFTYKITNLINGKYYYGCHSTNNIYDGYMGGNRELWGDIEKYGHKEFSIDLIENYKTSEEKYNAETKLVTLSVINDELSYNNVTGGKFGTGKLSNKMKEKIGINSSNRKVSKDTRLKMSVSQKINKTGLNKKNYNGMLINSIHKSKGIYFTPFGNFYSSYDAENKTSISRKTIESYCKNRNEIKFKFRSSKLEQLKIDYKNKAPKELGFSYLSFDDLNIKDKIVLCKIYIKDFNTPRL